MQLLQSIRLIAQGGTTSFGVDTGAANVYTVAYTPPIPALTNGLLLRFKAKTANTSGSTFSPNGLAAKSLVGLSTAALQGGEIVADGFCSVVYSASMDKWILLESTGGAVQVGAATKSQHAMQLGQATGRLLRTTVYINSAGVLQSSVDGSAFTNASSTFAAHPLALFAEGEVQGGGGSGGNALSTSAGNAAVGSGGSGGGYARKRAPISFFQGAAITVAAGGAAGALANGGTTTIGSLISASGGVSGVTGTNQAPANQPYEGTKGDIGSGGDINALGGYGWFGIYSSPRAISGKGGSSMFGEGAAVVPSVATTGASGQDAESYGAGGSGASNGASVPSTRNGGAGKGGLIIIKEYA